MSTEISHLIERVARFFDIFDLSFIVSGTAATGALVVLANASSIATIQPGSFSFIESVLAIFVAYILGLLCFAFGRWLRLGLTKQSARENFDKRFKDVLGGHGLLQVREIDEYIQREESRGVWKLYVRLWAEVRHSCENAPSVSLINRYWVMAATYDGLAVAIAFWLAPAIILGNRVFPDENLLVVFCAFIAIAVASLACSREAGRYFNYQIEELVATIAANRAKRER